LAHVIPEIPSLALAKEMGDIASIDINELRE